MWVIPRIFAPHFERWMARRDEPFSPPSMYLKSLTIHGFKSFADKTHFEFHKGVTGIVGPNGCGKSNVVDAIRWVLGETSAKALRGSEMADVIFNGTDKRKAVGMAEVVLTLADCEGSLGVDYNEVSVCRRVFRDGHGEYRMNGTVCRLKDVHDLFAGTGIGRAAYSIMAQGQIDMLLSSKPEDRRAVFEEAAGITKFKGQKKEALRKLEFTEANLLRVADIVAEVKRQMGSLQRQAAKARRYQSLIEDLRTLDTHQAHKHFVEFAGEKSETTTQVRALTAQIEDLQSRLVTAEAEAHETREAYHAVESTIGSLRAQVQELRSQVQSAEGRVGFNKERADELQTNIRQNEERIEASQQLLEEQRAELVSADEQLIVLSRNIEERQMAVNEHGSQHQFIIPERSRLEGDRRNVREAIRMCEGQMAGSDAKVQSLTTQIAGDRQRYESLQHDRQMAAEARETSQIEFDDLHRQIQELEQTRTDLDERLKHCAYEIVEQKRQLNVATEELTQAQRQRTQCHSRLEVLEQMMKDGQGLAQGTQHVLKGMDNPEVYSTGVRGLLASAIEVDQEYIPPIEAALRDHLQAVLLTDSELAGQILDRLADKKMGKAALVPQDFCTLRPAVDRQLLPEGGLFWAVDKVRVRPGVQTLVDHLLCNVLIVQDLQTALRVKRQLPDLAIVTMAGELVSTEGVIFGGASADEEVSTLRRDAELRSLRSDLERLTAQAREKEEIEQQLRTTIDEQQREEIALREQSQRARESFSSLQGKLSVVQRALQQASTRLESIEWDQGRIQERLQNAESQIAQLKEATAMTNEQLESHRIRENELELEMEAFLRRELESSERLNELRTALALEQSAMHSLERQKGPMATRLNELQSSIGRYDLEINTWRSRIHASEGENARLAEQISSQKSAIASIDEALAEKTHDRNASFERVTALENQLVQIRQQHGSLTATRSRCEVQLTRVDLRLENLVTQVRERYNFDIEAFEPDYHVLMMTIADQGKGKGRIEKRKDAEVATPAAGDEKSENLDDEVDDPVPTVVIGNSPPPELEGEEVPQIRAISEIAGSDDDDLNADDIVLPEEIGTPDWDLVAELVTEMRQKLEGIGPVNLDAIQEFEELEERHRFLDTQHQDLVKSKDELLQVIAKINETTKTMFAETFELVRGYFHNNFKELFGPQARADLSLMGDGDPLEAGIDIMAKPPGKKLQTITLLSGGERSMTAVALLFSIYQVKPSPFCVLDELDAPLDESNISRFLKMLDNFISNSQFIIVTHNKRTMNRADVIYGVTMQEFGVSKPVGVRLTPDKDSPKTNEQVELEAALEAEEGRQRHENAAAATEAAAELELSAVGADEE